MRTALVHVFGTLLALQPVSQPSLSRGAIEGTLSARNAKRARAAGLELEQLEAAVRALLACFRTGHKLLIFGNGGSGAHAQHMAAEFVGRVGCQRDPLPAVALTTDASVITAIANDFGFEHVFSRQVSALGRPGDIAVVISTSGTSPNVIAGARAARAAGMRILAITGAPELALARVADLAVTVATADTQQIQEAHMVAAHSLCETVETLLAGDGGAEARPATAAGKVVSLADLLELRAGWRAARRTVVWTNGVFDLLHAGHVRSLEMAKSFGDILVVGVNADAAVRDAKGSDRPVVPERQRAELVAGLASVDYVTIFAEAAPSEVLGTLQPEVHCKGRDYETRSLPERAVVEGYGGRVELLPVLPGVSSTELVRRIADAAPLPDG